MWLQNDGRIKTQSVKIEEIFFLTKKDKLKLYKLKKKTVTQLENVLMNELYTI